MGRAPAQKTKERIDRLANVLVKMERGEWQWPDGKPRWMKENGIRKPRVVKKDAFEHVWGKGGNAQYDVIFSEKGRLRPLLEERLAYHRQRLDGGYREALANLTGDGNALAVMSNKLYESLWWDLNDEETRKAIPFRERAKFFEVLTKMEASIKGDVATQAKERLHPSVVIQTINVPDSVRERMMSNIEDIEVEVEEEQEEQDLKTLNP